MENLIVLGSGRSGTSMLAGALSGSGYYMGENADYLGKNEANPKGFFEDREVNTINEDILKLSLPDFPEWLRRNFFPTSTFYRARWLARVKAHKIIRTSPDINKRIQKVISKTPFCFKDPRFSYTLPIWQQQLEMKTKFIVIYRHPNKTMESIVRECKENRSLRKLKMTNSIALNIWIAMYSHILKNFSNSPNKEDWFFTHFDQLFDSEVCEKLEKFTGAKINLDFPEKKMSRASESNTVVPKNFQFVYEELKLLSSYSIAP